MTRNFDTLTPAIGSARPSYPVDVLCRYVARTMKSAAGTYILRLGGCCMLLDYLAIAGLLFIFTLPITMYLLTRWGFGKASGSD